MSISPLAYVHPDAKLGANVVVEPFASIYADVVVGEGTWIGPNAVLMDGTRVGRKCRIFPGAVIGGLVIGLIEQFSGVYMNSSLKDVAAYVVILVVLFLRPQGLFGNIGRKRV